MKKEIHMKFPICARRDWKTKESYRLGFIFLNEVYENAIEILKQGVQWTISHGVVEYVETRNASMKDEMLAKLAVEYVETCSAMMNLFLEMHP